MLKRLFLTLLLSAPLFAQYVPVSAKLTDGTGNVSKTAFLHFELQGAACDSLALKCTRLGTRLALPCQPLATCGA